MKKGSEESEMSRLRIIDVDVAHLARYQRFVL